MPGSNVRASKSAAAFGFGATSRRDKGWHCSTNAAWLQHRCRRVAALLQRRLNELRNKVARLNQTKGAGNPASITKGWRTH
jgi:hypothetical protein